MNETIRKLAMRAANAFEHLLSSREAAVFSPLSQMNLRDGLKDTLEQYRVKVREELSSVHTNSVEQEIILTWAKQIPSLQPGEPEVPLWCTRAAVACGFDGKFLDDHARLIHREYLKVGGK